MLLRNWGNRPDCNLDLSDSESRIWKGLFAGNVSLHQLYLWGLVNGAVKITAGINVFNHTGNQNQNPAKYMTSRSFQGGVLGVKWG